MDNQYTSKKKLKPKSCFLVKISMFYLLNFRCVHHTVDWVTHNILCTKCYCIVVVTIVVFNPPSRCKSCAFIRITRSPLLGKIVLFTNEELILILDFITRGLYFWLIDSELLVVIQTKSAYQPNLDRISRISPYTNFEHVGINYLGHKSRL